MFESRQLTTVCTATRGGGMMGAREGGRPGGALKEAAFEGRKFGILAFALQCVTVSLYLFLLSAQDGCCRLEGRHHTPLPSAAKKPSRRQTATTEFIVVDSLEGLGHAYQDS